MMRLVYLSPVPWGSYTQRPQRFVEWFNSRSNGKVLWIDPYPTRFPVLSDFWHFIRNGIDESQINTEGMPWLTVLRLRAIPIEPFPGSGIINHFLWRDVFKAVDDFFANDDCLIGIGKPSLLALQLLIRYNQIPSLYDAMDDFPAFYHGWSRMMMRRREREIARKVTKIAVSCTALASHFETYRSKLSIILNACAPDTFPSVNTKINKSESIILGYVGTIGNWFDWEFVIGLAEACPYARIRLIGPTFVLPTRSLPGNIELLPACNHDSAIKAMLEFNVGLIPFKRIDLTASVDPIKYYEYRALGLPVISTCFGEMALRENEKGVFLVHEKHDVMDVLESALSYKYGINEIQKIRINNSWAKRFDAIGIF